MTEGQMCYITGILSLLKDYIVVHGPYQCKDDRYPYLIASMSIEVPEDQISELVSVLKAEGVSVNVKEEINMVDD